MAVYACSDLHGCYRLYEKIVNMLNPGDRVIFLGDAADRGPDNLKTIRAIKNNPDWMYLKGNHEDMMVQAFRKGSLTSFYNGGTMTYREIDNAEDKEELLEYLDNLPYLFYYKGENGNKYWLCHAGFTYRGDNPFEYCSNYDLVWSRTHFMDSFDDDIIIVHGHTPIEYLGDGSFDTQDGHWMGKAFHSPYLYANNHKIDIDAGSFYTHETYLLNLDTFEYTLIKEEGDELQEWNV